MKMISQFRPSRISSRLTPWQSSTSDSASLKTGTIIEIINILDARPRWERQCSMFRISQSHVQADLAADANLLNGNFAPNSAQLQLDLPENVTAWTTSPEIFVH